MVRTVSYFSSENHLHVYAVKLELKAKSVFSGKGEDWFLFGFINKFSKCLMVMVCSFYLFTQEIFTEHHCVPGTTLGTGDTAKAKQPRSLFPS